MEEAPTTITAPSAEYAARFGQTAPTTEHVEEQRPLLVPTTTEHPAREEGRPTWGRRTRRRGEKLKQRDRRMQFGPVVKEATRVLCELYGTFVITVVSSVGTVGEVFTLGRVPPYAGALGVALVTSALIYAVGHISGGHFNPIITLAFALRRMIKWWRVLLYWLAQLIGSVIGAALVYAIFGNLREIGSSLPQHGISFGGALGLELLFSLFLVLTVLHMGNSRGMLVGTSAAIAVGTVLLAVGLIGGPITGASMNPAKSLGPAIVSGGIARNDYWIYVFGPLIGCLIATAISYLFYWFGTDLEELEEGEEEEQEERRRVAIESP
jgi:MIP family channel proteins